MSSAQQRDRVAQAVQTDIAGAEALASAIDDPWYRAQAWGWCARYAPDEDVLRFAKLGMDSAADCEDPHQQAGAAAWPIRALIERGHGDDALQLLEIASMAVPRVTSAVSRSDALLLLFRAAFDTSAEVRRSILYALAELADGDEHWRVERNLGEALAMAKGIDPEFVTKLARGAIGEAEARAFYW